MSDKRAAKSRRLGCFGWCPTHEKALYDSKSRAKAAIREFAEKGMRPYRCELVDGCWHVGHLPAVIREGRKTARQVYGR